LFSYFVKD